MMRFLSLGAGVQSTTMALMAAKGMFDAMPDYALFADTGAEPASVYKHLEWLSNGILPFPIIVVSDKNLLTDITIGKNSTGQRFAAIPYFLDRSMTGHPKGMGRRQCTKEYKIEPLARAQRQLLGYVPRARIPAGTAEVWIGISTDEAIRMKPARAPWQTNRWPLIEHRISRSDCLAWLDRNNYPRPPKSACTFCPYRSDEQWLMMKRQDPDAFEQAAYVDDFLRSDAAGNRQKLKAVPFIHSSLKPLREVTFDPSRTGQNDLFGDECEGMCGV